MIQHRKREEEAQGTQRIPIESGQMQRPSGRSTETVGNADEKVKEISNTKERAAG
jgi:hypothetical protein